MSIGRPINLTDNVATKTISVTATANQTEFTIVGGYRINQIDVFRNGVKLTPQTDFQAADASKVILTDPANLNDEVSFKIFDTFSVADVIVGAASSQTIFGDLRVTGKFYGNVGTAGTWTNYDNNTGVTTTKKVKIQNDFEVTGVSTFGNINATTGSFSGNINATTGSFSGDVSVGGTLTYEDVTNVDSVGVITARSGIRIGTVGTGGTIGPVGSGIVTYYGDGSQLTGIDATSLKDGDGTIRVQANTSGAVVTGVLTATDFDGVDVTALRETKGGTIRVQANTSGAVVTGVLTATSFDGIISGNVKSSWTLGANGISDYTFTGPGLTGAENDPTLYLVRGDKYAFVNSMGAHPFRIQSTPNGSTGTIYNDGITNNDVSNGTLTWDVQFDAPDTLYYQCTSHPDMGGIIYIGDYRRSLYSQTKSADYTLLKTDSGNLIKISSGNITVPSNVFADGDIVTIYNNSGVTRQVQASGTTLRKAGSANTGTCTIDNYGTASILCVGTNEFVVSGNIS